MSDQSNRINLADFSHSDRDDLRRPDPVVVQQIAAEQADQEAKRSAAATIRRVLSDFFSL